MAAMRGFRPVRGDYSTLSPDEPEDLVTAPGDTISEPEGFFVFRRYNKPCRKAAWLPATTDPVQPAAMTVLLVEFDSGDIIQTYNSAKLDGTCFRPRDAEADWTEFVDIVGDVVIDGRTITVDTGGPSVPLTDYLTVYKISAGEILDPELSVSEIAQLAGHRNVSTVLAAHGWT